MASHQKPCLLLVTPRVADVGNAYILEPGPSRYASDALSTVAENARRNGDRGLAVKHLVAQAMRGMERTGDEWLIWMGATLENPSRDLARVQSILARLLAARAGKPPDGLSPAGPFVYTAAFMSEWSDQLQQELAGIPWREEPIAPAAPASPVKPRPRKKALWVAALLIALIIVAQGYIPRFPLSRDTPRPGPTNAPMADKTKPPSLAGWQFLTGAEWKNLLESTGGGAIAPILEPPPADPATLIKQIEDWAFMLQREFNVSTSKPLKPAEFKTTFEGLVAGKLPDWFRHAGGTLFSRDADSLVALKPEELFSQPKDQELAAKVRKVLSALRDWENQHTGTKQFDSLLNLKLPELSPGEYTILTPMDVERLQTIQSFLGSMEFGLLVTGEPYGNKQTGWGWIRRRLETRSSGTDSLIRTLAQQCDVQPPAGEP